MSYPTAEVDLIMTFSIEPQLKIALGMQSNPGVYALLLGSGISRAAEIPTGWDIVLDLVKNIAISRGQENLEDLEIWYREQFDEAPDYSKLLANMTRTQAERQALLKPYFEPKQEEKAEGIKVPTSTHKAIARMVKHGYIKMILTTNFDRLLETALEAEGVVPDIISNENDLLGAIPFTHSKCYLIKLHGDYLDTRIRNTGEELEHYPPEINQLLDRILDEFGLIVAGWSGAWDTALRDALSRCKTHRYATYWLAYQGQLTTEARQLIQQRRAEIINIKSADEFFNGLEEKVLSLDEIKQPHPLSTAVAVTTVKRYLPDPLQQIRLYDLFREETEKVIEDFSSDRFDKKLPITSDEIIQKRRADYEVSMEKLLGMVAALAFHGTERHSEILQNMLERLVNWPLKSGYSIWIDLQYYPALLCVYTAGIGAIAAKKYNCLASVFIRARYYDYEREKPAVYKLHIGNVFNNRDTQMKITGQKEKYYTPASIHICNLLRSTLKDYLPDDKSYNLAFDLFEYLLSLIYLEQVERDWCPIGRSIWRYFDSWQEFNNSPLGHIIINEQELEGKGPLLQAGLFNGSVEILNELVQVHMQIASKARGYWF